MADYSDKYSEEGFWKKIRKVRKSVPFLRDVLAMFYCLIDSTTPIWAKGVIVAALGYFIFPLDVIPDFLFPIGYADDAAVVTTALIAVRMLIKEEHWQKADDVLRGL
jgi:uncharacterized membrane protein YkvA (DUF1232 family)